MFSCNYGDETLNIREDDSTVAEDSGEECGSVALASWNTQVEYDNLKVKDKNGEIIFEDDFDDGKIDESKWVIQSGQWKEEDGVLRQTGGETPALIYLNQDVLPEGFSGGSVAVEATKTGGAEGFLVGYDFRDTENYYWYNVGYLNNTADKVERSVNNVRQAFLTTAGNLYKNTETGTTYSIEINYDSDSAEIYKDNVLPMTYGTHYIYSCATRDSATGDIYLKLVNSEGKDKKVHIDVENMDGNFRSAVKTEMASYDKNIQNSIRQPENIRPKTSVITDMTELESYTIPAYSVTVLQLSRKESEAEPPEEEDNLQLYYKFDSKAGAEVKDYSGNGYNGTMQVLGGGETEDPAWTEEGFAFSGNNYIKLTGADLVSEDTTVASLIAFIAGSTVNAWILSRMKVLTKGRAFWARAVLSSVGGELVDSCIFFPFVFWGMMPASVIAGMVFTQVVVKTLYEIVVLPLTSWIVRRLKAKEGIDTYDTAISYNPFKLSDIQ